MAPSVVQPPVRTRYFPLRMDLLGIQPINLGGHDEVALGQTVYLVSPECDFRFSPTQQDVGMMSLFFGELTHTIHKRQRLLKIRKGKGSRYVVLVDDLPLRPL